MSHLDPFSYLLSTDGVNQSQRRLPALDAAFVRPDERTRRDLLRFWLTLAEQIRFYDLDNHPSGDWRPFFDALLSGGELASEAQLAALEASRRDWSPHLVLLWAFLRLFGYAQTDLNRLTGRHLQFYYEEVLRLQRRSARPDRVHVVFELSKNAPPTRLLIGSLLDGGKTADGLAIRYALDSELIVQQTRVHSQRSIFVDTNANGKKIVYRADDARAVTTEGTLGWRPFGAAQLTLPPESRTMVPAGLGFAVASPALQLAEGERTVTLTLHLHTEVEPPPPGQPLTPFVEVTITGEEGWLPPTTLTAELTDDQQLVLTMTYSAVAAPLTPYQEAIHQAGFPTTWPVLRCIAKPEAYLLETLGQFTITSADLEVGAAGVRSLALQNDQSGQPADKPALPFGAQPFIGANFYIGSTEAFSKSLTSVKLSLEWQDPPEDFGDYYSAYGNPNISNAVFTTDLYLLAGRNWNTRLLNNQTLFQSTDPTAVKELEVLPATFSTQTAGSGFGRQPGLGPVTAFSSRLTQGFIKLVLTGPTRADLGNQPPGAPFEAFGHKAFATRYAQQAIALSQFDGIGTAPELPQPPYTPLLKSVTLDYTARETFKPDSPNGIDQFFIQDVFGPGEVMKNEAARLVPLLPGQGALYLGLERSVAPQLVSLLFQVEEGNVPGATLLEPGDAAWSYLAGDQWRLLAPQDIAEDSTDGLQQPGLIRLTLGADADTDHTILPAGLHWLRAAVAERADGAGALLAVAAQAASATLVLPDAEEEIRAFETHLASPLPAKGITGLVTKVSNIKTVHQDFPSFDGLPPESDDGFYRRASERLRHRQRAVTAWDYERLLLEAFPTIYKVKTLPHTDENNQLIPGHVRAVVVPDWRRRPTGNPLQPRANAAFLREMEQYLADDLVTAFTQVHVTNPTYETLLVDAKVAFREGFDPGFYALTLNEEIRRFLSPWAYEEGRDIQFGGRIYKSELLAFVEGRVYVDYVVDFQVYHRHAGGAVDGIGLMTIGEDFIIGNTPRPTIGPTAIGIDFVVGEPVEVAAATRPDAILVSNTDHRIEALRTDEFACSGVQTVGIGQMIIGIDFIPIS